MSMANQQDMTALLTGRPPSVGRMFFDRVEKTPDRPAYSFPVGDTWTTITWRESSDRVARIAAGLISLGVAPEERVAIACSTRFEWILADLAIMSAGAATTTVYPSTITEDVAFIIGDSQSRVVFAEDDIQVEKLRSSRDSLPALTTVVTFDGTADGDWVLGLDDLERRGAQLLADDPEVVRRRVDATQPDHLATVVYTSGTTGRPKGVRLPHSAWTYEGVVVEELAILSIDDVQYLWLPLAHVFGKVLLTVQLAIGFVTAVDGRVDKIIDNLAVVKPTFMGAAPRIFEKAHARVVTLTADEGGLKKKIFDRAFTVGLEVTRREQAGEKIPATLAAQNAVFDKLVFSKIRARFGGRIRFFVSGAAALNRDLAAWFHAAGLLVLEGYGLTETSAGTCLNLPTHYKFGTVGQVFQGSEIRCAPDGELLIKGPGVMTGYHNADVGDDALQDGWFHTGDVGEIDSEGFVRITDRKKDVFKTSGGKYVAPQIIEGQFKTVCPYVSQILVHGNERNFVSALITLDPDAIEQWAAGQGLAGRSYSEIVTSPQAQAMVQGYVDEVNAKLNGWETIKKFVVLDRDLSVETGELTPSLKVKRKVVEKQFAGDLDALYA
ncbi:MAG TPA: AMP-dependent synthetase/ligase [Nocardioidaceae bacterium]|nr:AMP-dependent synthetase/ligase [Nocardioidaceae bacterium]